MAACISCVVDAVLLLVAANGGPVLARLAWRGRYAWPVDGGLRLFDGRPLFGTSKTWRGLIAALGSTMAVAWCLDLEVLLGGLFALLAMTGDLSSSFCKRRLGKVESSRARGLDTLPESLLPAWALKSSLHLSDEEIVLVAGLFFFLEEVLPLLPRKWHIGGPPY